MSASWGGVKGQNDIVPNKAESVSIKKILPRLIVGVPVCLNFASLPMFA